MNTSQHNSFPSYTHNTDTTERDTKRKAYTTRLLGAGTVAAALLAGGIHSAMNDAPSIEATATTQPAPSTEHGIHTISTADEMLDSEMLQKNQDLLEAGTDLPATVRPYTVEIAAGAGGLAEQAIQEAEQRNGDADLSPLQTAQINATARMVENDRRAEDISTILQPDELFTVTEFEQINDAATESTYIVSEHLDIDESDR